MEEIKRQIEELAKKIKVLEEKRIYQRDIAPEGVKMRHVGEGVRFIRSGLAADRPTEGEVPLQGTAIFLATDTNVMSIWDNTNGAWVDFKRVPAAPSAYTQTYSTADRTHANPTASTLTVSDGAGTNDNTIGAITGDASVIAAFQEVVDEINKLIADEADSKQLINGLIDDLQSIGLIA